MKKPKFTLEETGEKTRLMKFDGRSVTIKTLDTRTCRVFQLVWKVGKHRNRKGFVDEAKALTRAEEILESLSAARGDLTTVDPESLAYFQECEKKLDGTPLHIAVNFYLAHQERSSSSMTVREAVKELVRTKAADTGLSRRYMETMASLLGKFTSVFGDRKLTSLDHDELEGFVKDTHYAPKTQENLHRMVSMLYRFAERRKMVPLGSSPILEIAPPKVRAHTKEVVTPDELRAILKATPEREIPFVALSAWGGGRRAEIQRLNFEDIDLDEKIVRMSCEITKTAQRRTLEICENLAAWLEPYRGRTGKIVRVDDPLHGVRMALGDEWDWKPNGLRHGFISYHLAIHRNAAATAEQAGNSPQIINSQYKALVSRSAAEEWFAIRPENI